MPSRQHASILECDRSVYTTTIIPIHVQQLLAQVSQVLHTQTSYPDKAYCQ